MEKLEFRLLQLVVTQYPIERRDQGICRNNTMSPRTCLCILKVSEQNVLNSILHNQHFHSPHKLYFDFCIFFHSFSPTFFGFESLHSVLLYEENLELESMNGDETYFAGQRVYYPLKISLCVQ